MRTARILLLLLVLGGAAAGLATWQPWSGDDAIVDPSQDRAIAEVVGIRTLTEEITIRVQTGPGHGVRQMRRLVPAVDGAVPQDA